MNKQSYFVIAALVFVGGVLAYFTDFLFDRSTGPLAASGNVQVGQIDEIDPRREEPPLKEIFNGNAALAKLQLTTRNTPFKKNIVLPNDTKLSIYFDSRTAEQKSVNVTKVSDLDDGVSGGFFDTLKHHAAQGNGDVAVYLFKSLQKCENAPKSDEELTSIIDKSVASQEPQRMGIDIDKSIELLRAARIRCDSVVPSMHLKAGEFLRDAADKGHVESALRYANFVKTSSPSESLGYYKQAWDMGNFRGLIGMAEYHSNLASQTHESRIDQFAYLYAAKAIQLSLFDGLEGPVTAMRTERLVEELTLLERSVPSSVSEAGMDLVKELLDENSNCCSL